MNINNIRYLFISQFYFVKRNPAHTTLPVAMRQGYKLDGLACSQGRALPRNAVYIFT